MGRPPLQPDGSTTLLDATKFLDTFNKGLIDAGLATRDGNRWLIPPIWNDRTTPSGWAEGSGSREHPIDVDVGHGTQSSPINVDLGSAEVPIEVEDDSLALAIPAPVTPALPLFLAESDRPTVDV